MTATMWPKPVRVPGNSRTGRPSVNANQADGGDGRNSKSPSAQVASLPLQVRPGTSRWWYLGASPSAPGSLSGGAGALHLPAASAVGRACLASSPSSLSACRLRHCFGAACASEGGAALGLHCRSPPSRQPRRQGEPRPPTPLDAGEALRGDGPGRRGLWVAAALQPGAPP